MTNIYKIPMNKLVLAALLIFIAVVSAVVAWSFNSGLTWTGICLIVVAGPLSCLYWYMLYVNPKRASITVADEGILLSAPPFASAVIPWASVEKAFAAKLTDPKFKISKTKKIMSFGKYRSGIAELENGSEAVIVTNQTDILCIQTEGRYYLLGPAMVELFTQDVEKIMQQKTG